MANYAVQNRLTGLVVDAYEADAPDHTQAYPFDTYNHILQTPVIEIVRRRVTKLELISRLDADYIPLLEASKQSVAVEAFIKMLDWATPEADGTSIDLDDPRLVQALNMFEQAQLIQPGRALEILA